MEQELIITRKEQARAPQDVAFLGAFLEPASPSDVAHRLGMRANLAHHHAQKHTALGLLLTEPVFGAMAIKTVEVYDVAHAPLANYP